MAARLLRPIGALGAFADPRGKAGEGGAHELLDGGGQQLRAVARFGGEDAQQLGLAVELGEHVAGGQRQFGFEVAQRSEHVADVAERVEALRAGARCRRRAPLPCSRSGGRARPLPA